ncbi:MAG: efflux RND transporter periplasmic adaptor subunit [Deltaproteobacteria bacterium]|nr:efflux RND transporter periplasmic adaptor subunit [Deltaproteobacteria bacterium]
MSTTELTPTPANAQGPLSVFKRRKKLTAAVLVLAGLIVFRFVSGLAAPFGGPPTPEAVYVELAEGSFGTMRQLGRYYGSLSAPNRFFLSSKASGEIKSLLADIGDRLANGQLVAVLDDEEHVLSRDRAAMNVKLAEAQTDEAKANLELAASDMSRQSSLSKKNIVTQSDFEAAENRLRQAQARLAVAVSQLEAARNQLSDAELRLSWTRVVASWPGSGAADDFRYVGARLADEGQLATANQPLFELVSIDPLLVQVDVIEKDYPKISPGMSATVAAEAFPGERFAAKVLRVAPVLSSDSRQARLELEVANPDLRLKPGMYADVVFVFDERREVWSVAQDVPFRRQDGYVIFVADPVSSTVKELPVELGLVEDGRVELRGLKGLDGPVVVLGQHLLEDGQVYRAAGQLAAPAEGGRS